MKKVALVVVLLLAVAGIAFYMGQSSRPSEEAASGQGGPAGAGGGRGRGAGGGGGRGGFGGPMTVEVATARRGQVMQQLIVVGNLVGDATVAVVPRAAGRLQDISVKL